MILASGKYARHADVNWPVLAPTSITLFARTPIAFKVPTRLSDGTDFLGARSIAPKTPGTIMKFSTVLAR
jgi:hypothetical protein